MELSRFHKILLGTLVLQLGLAIVMWTRGDDRAVQRPTPLFASFDASTVTRLTVAGSGTTPAIELSRQGDGWVLTSSFGYPVVKTKVDDLLAAIGRLQAAAPIATQPARHKQLRVADTEFERKLVLSFGGKDSTLWVGAGAGPRRTAIRLGADPRVFAVGGLDVQAIGTEPRAWVDPSYVQVAADELASITVARPGVTLEVQRDGAQWKPLLDGAPLALGEGEAIDAAAIDRLVAAATTIELVAPADPKRDASKPLATITLARKPQGATSPAPITIDVAEDGSSYWVHDRALDRAVRVDPGRLRDVLEVGRDQLVTKEEAPPSVAKPVE